MTKKFFSTPAPFTASAKGFIPVIPVREKTLGKALSKLGATAKTRAAESGFKGKPGTHLFLHDGKGRLSAVLAGINNPLQIYDLPPAVEAIGKNVAAASLGKLTFALEPSDLTKAELERACIGWALACHRYDFYKKDKDHTPPRLIWPKGVRRDYVTALVGGICLIRNLVNTPANDLGPEELEQAARHLAKQYEATVTTIAGAKLEQGFPLIHAVGVSSPRAPRLIDLRWGNVKHPKLTLVGKGVCFDTGGLDLKPGPFMLQMKKDMGGSAHTLGLALAIMALKLPVRLRVLIPAVENSVSGTSFRPRDIYKTRKGLTVETSDTDAEGRLVLSDALTYACEEKPDLIIDCATLTGSARSALGYDIPAMFSNRDALAHELKQTSLLAEDPLWPMPLWQGYKKEISSDIADLNNIGSSPAGAIHGALFLEYFVDPDVPWLHIDMYAWEQTGKPGRPKGGADTGMRAMLAFLEERYK